MSSTTETAAVSMEILESTTHGLFKTRGRVDTFLQRFYTFLLVMFYLSNLVVFLFCVWIFLMENQNYLFDVMTESDTNPPMRWVVRLGIASGTISMIVSSLGVLGLYGKVRHVLSVFMIGLSVVSFMQIAMGLTAREFKLKYNETTLMNYTFDLARNRYATDDFSKLLMDKIQYYNGCCGAEKPEDYYFGDWFMKYRDTEQKAFVPLACCKMKEDSTFHDMKPLFRMCTIVTYNSELFRYIANREGCAKIFSEKVQQYPVFFEHIGLYMAGYTVFVMVFVLLMIDKELYYKSLLS